MQEGRRRQAPQQEQPEAERRSARAPLGAKTRNPNPRCYNGIAAPLGILALRTLRDIHR